MKRLLGIALIIFTTINLHAQIENIIGDWATVDDKTGQSSSIVHIYKGTNGKYYGRITKMLIDGTENLLCTECKDKYHNVPLVGLVFIHDMEYKNGSLSGGRVLDPESGKFYYGKISYSAKTGKLELRGSLDKRGILGRSQYWNRAK